MKLIDLVNFLRTPADRDVIARWTAARGPHSHALNLPQPPDPERFTFLALGDTGDSAGVLSGLSPQDAVAQYLAADAAAPVGTGAGAFVLHTGDVVYMAGERRLYDRNFRRPYAPFLTPESTVDDMVFRLPFLPVPGNHDYYDFAGWATLLRRTPLIGAGVEALARELFSFQIPAGGSDMGAAYMHAFVDQEPEENNGQYLPGVRTRLPNRYYRFQYGNAEFFALDSNTLEAPPPQADLAQEREAAAKCVEALAARARRISRELGRDEKAVEGWLEDQRRMMAEDAERVALLAAGTETVATALHSLVGVLNKLRQAGTVAPEPVRQVKDLYRQWSRAAERLRAAAAPAEAERALERLDEAIDAARFVLEGLEACFTGLAESPERQALLEAREAAAAAIGALRKNGAGRPPEELCNRIHQLSAEALDIQRQLALERRRMGRRPDDHDIEQLEWLRDSLAESVRERPDAWRIVYLHQPLYTTIGDHSENADVVGVRENLIPLLRDHVHLVLAGHAHAFEWFRSALLPHTGFIITGGGGQPWLWNSVLNPKRRRRFRPIYRSLRDGGVLECIAAGNGPAAPDGEAGPLYHYVRVEVSPEKLRVVPVGVRRARAGYRTEVPMPVYHVPELPPEESGRRPPWHSRQLEAVEIYRDAEPVTRWA